ncbi:MAG TPA: hypothetical protein VI112_06915 [Bacteroidia bacterium]|jgi:hypothetical protein
MKSHVINLTFFFVLFFMLDELRAQERVPNLQPMGKQEQVRSLGRQTSVPDSISSKQTPKQVPGKSNTLPVSDRKRTDVYKVQKKTSTTK